MEFCMKQFIQVTAGGGGDSWLILGSEKTALVDTGMEYCSTQLADNIKAVLGDRPLDYVLLTHSHYDHVSGLPALRKEWPHLTAAAHPHAAKIMSKEKAIEFMRTMSAEAYRLHDPEHSVRNYPVSDYHIDLTVQDGSEIDLGDLKVQVYETPGHTKCCISFYVQPLGLLFPAETCGLPEENDPVTVKPSYLTSYVSTIKSIQKLKDLELHALIPAHSPYQDDPSIHTFLDRAICFAQLSKDFILGMYQNGLTQDEILKIYAAVYCRNIGTQPLHAFMVNAEAAIQCVIREYEAGEISL